MRNDELDVLVERRQGGEQGLDREILEHIARDMYGRPRVYGFRSEDDVGEVLERYWRKIGALVDRYEDTGCSFRTYAITSIRYMARSIRREYAKYHDREEIYCSEVRESLRAEAGAVDYTPVLPRHRRSRAGIPPQSDRGLLAMAFRRRVLFVCLKCANSIDDDQAREIADSVGLDARELLYFMHHARASGLGLRRRTESRRRGRDAAWLRMNSDRLRLSREVDEESKRRLGSAIQRNHELYLRAVRLIASSRPVLSNKMVADMLGVPKGTVDCGVRRILKRFEELYTEGKDV